MTTELVDAIIESLEKDQVHWRRQFSRDLSEPISLFHEWSEVWLDTDGKHITVRRPRVKITQRDMQRLKKACVACMGWLDSHGGLDRTEQERRQGRDIIDAIHTLREMSNTTETA